LIKLSKNLNSWICTFQLTFEFQFKGGIIIPKFKILNIVTDGASRKNPGPSAIAYRLYDENWKVIEEKSDYIGDATNNEAEYKALISALDCATKYCREEIIHYTDSQLVVNQLNGIFAVKAKNLKPLIEKIHTKERFFKKVEHKFLPRSNPKIQAIDKLVNEKLDKEGF